MSESKYDRTQRWKRMSVLGRLKSASNAAQAVDKDHGFSIDLRHEAREVALKINLLDARVRKELGVKS